MHSDEKYMRLALKEAKKGLGRTSPNPCVGAVIVKDGRILGRGFHRKAGTPHAEINAFRAAKESVRGATMYVTLEPCSHTGKTPPCCEAIVAESLSRVVVGMTDPNPLVNGNGIAYLQHNGIDVSSGVLAEECLKLNFPFHKYITTGLPWVILKAGISLDGKLNYERGKSGWITGEQSRIATHKLRDKVDAILVGRQTVAIDNPCLTTRLSGAKTKDPIRIIIDGDLSLPISSHVYNLDSAAPTWVCCYGTAMSSSMALQLQEKNVKLLQVEKSPFGLDLNHLLRILGKNGITSVLVEGGAHVHGSFLREKLVDYVHLFSAPIFAGAGGVSLLEGYSLPGRDFAPRLTSVVYTQLGDDVMIEGKVTYPESDSK